MTTHTQDQHTEATPPEQERVAIFDTTLRDGEQSPGATLTVSEKIRLARQLARLGVNIIEAGFPAASRDDFLAVRGIAERIGASGTSGPVDHPPVICGLARATHDDIEAAWEAVRPAERPRIHTFLATSDIHIEHKLRSTRQRVLERITDAVGFATSLCADVEFSAEDASRTDRDFLCEAVSAALRAGATTINIPDTVGYTTPAEFGALFRYILAKVPEARGAVLSAHCHNDLGLATANTFAALLAGARQAEVAINGIGERAGNAALEEIVMLLQARGDAAGLATTVDSTQIIRTSRMVSDMTGMQVQPNKAVVGANAFSHEAGIHQDGVLKHESTYEIMRPESVGLVTSKLVIGKHSGRHAFRVHLADLGYELDDETLAEAFECFKALADKKKTVTDSDIEALLSDLLQQTDGGHRLVDLQVVCGRVGMPTATVRLSDPDGMEHIAAAVGAGPVDAVYRAIHEIVSIPNHLREYNVHGITSGIDAQGRVAVQLAGSDGHVVSGYGADTDIIVASAKAYIGALNRLMAHSPQYTTAGSRKGNE